jgi:hypothetical protein
MPYITVCPACSGLYQEQSREEADSPNRMCPGCWQSRSNTATAHKKPPSVLELNERGFVYPNAGVVLHQLLAALYRDGPNTEWNADMWQVVGGILDDAGLTYDHWPTPEEPHDSDSEGL